MDPRRVTIATVVDDHPPYTEEVALLFTSLDRFGGSMRKARRRAYLVDGVSDGTARELRRLGVDVRVVEPVDTRFRFLNKLAMLEGEAGEDTDLLVALDSDVVVAGDFGEHLEPRLVQAKQPDGDLLPIEIWERLFAHFGLELPAARHPTSLDPGWTHAYFNTGVLFLPGAVLEPLRERWLHFTRAIIDGGGIVDGIDEHLRGRVPRAPGATGEGLEHLYFAEQWGFALARHALHIPYAVLPLALNFPLITRDDQRPGEYIDARFMPDATRPVLLHHHHEYARGLRESGYAVPDEVIRWFNRQLLPKSRPEPPEAPTSRVVIQCNLLDAKGQPPRGYLAQAYWGMAAEHIQVVLRRKDGGWSLYSSRIDRFGNFRVKTLPEAHPRHGDERIMAFASREEAEAEVEALDRARARVVAERGGEPR